MQHIEASRAPLFLNHGFFPEGLLPITITTDCHYKGKTASIEIAPAQPDKWLFFVTIEGSPNGNKMWGEIERSRCKTEEEVLTQVMAMVQEKLDKPEI